MIRNIQTQKLHSECYCSTKQLTIPVITGIPPAGGILVTNKTLVHIYLSPRPEYDRVEPRNKWIWVKA